jgi:hypothetical protein
MEIDPFKLERYFVAHENDTLILGESGVKYHGRGGPWRPCFGLHVTATERYFPLRSP